MASLDSHNIHTPHETRPFQAHGSMDVVTLGDFTLGKGTFEPGWRWSADVKPIAGTDSCRTTHTGICVAGRMTVQMDDGTERVMKAGDLFYVPPGHDSWVVGDEPYVSLHIVGSEGYAT